MNEKFPLVLLAIMKPGQEKNEDSGKGGFRKKKIESRKENYKLLLYKLI
jgi:hypothetical protein